MCSALFQEQRPKLIFKVPDSALLGSLIVLLQRNGIEIRSICLPSLFLDLFPVGSYLGYRSRTFYRSYYVEKGNVAVPPLEKWDESCNAWAITLGNRTGRQWQFYDT